MTPLYVSVKVLINVGLVSAVPLAFARGILVCVGVVLFQVL